MLHDLKYAYTLTARYRCEVCGEVHGTGRAAMVCCPPGVCEIYACPVCAMHHNTTVSALECCNADSFGEKANPRGMIMESSQEQRQIGHLANLYCHAELPLQVLKTAAGFYIGTSVSDIESDLFGPVSRESEEYFPTEQAAQEALRSGRWTQKRYP